MYDDTVKVKLRTFLTNFDQTTSLFRSSNKRRASLVTEKCHTRGCGEDIRPDWKFCANCGAAVLVHAVQDEDFVSLKSMSTSTADRFEKKKVIKLSYALYYNYCAGWTLEGDDKLNSLTSMTLQFILGRQLEVFWKFQERKLDAWSAHR